MLATVVALLTAVFPFYADWNATHLFNQLAGVAVFLTLLGVSYLWAHGLPTAGENRTPGGREG